MTDHVLGTFAGRIGESGESGPEPSSVLAGIAKRLGRDPGAEFDHRFSPHGRR
jgi:hypothetical protein